MTLKRRHDNRRHLHFRSLTANLDRILMRPRQRRRVQLAHNRLMRVIRPSNLDRHRRTRRSPLRLTRKQTLIRRWRISRHRCLARRLTGVIIRLPGVIRRRRRHRRRVGRCRRERRRCAGDGLVASRILLWLLLLLVRHLRRRMRVRGVGGYGVVGLRVRACSLAAEDEPGC